MNLPLLQTYNLGHLAGILSRYEKPSIAFSLGDAPEGTTTHRSKLGGLPLLPSGFEWPHSHARPLDFLLQIDCVEVAAIDPYRVLPTSGLLTFFYDLENQPWGYDPKQLDGYRVVLIDGNGFVSTPLPSPEYHLRPRALHFGAGRTLPHFGSRDYDRLAAETRLLDEEWDRYFDFIVTYELKFYPPESGRHRMLGHSANVQGDMQLEAQLVTNGLYCGDETGYNDPRAKLLERKAGDWLLLLQLDSDDRSDLMWGDMGMLYFWIRQQDLKAHRFDRIWMSLQCG
jgi:uncharacterized protein YwqG